jgi:hypothetical protein
MYEQLIIEKKLESNGRTDRFGTGERWSPLVLVRARGRQSCFGQSRLSRVLPRIVVSQSFENGASAGHPCPQTWAGSRLLVEGSTRRFTKKGTEWTRKTGEFKGALRISLDTSLFLSMT